MARIKKRPDYEALDDLGFVGWGELTPRGEIEIPQLIQNFLSEQEAKKAAISARPKTSTRKSTSARRAKGIRSR